MRTNEDLIVCQVADPDIFLPCEAKLGPFRCERLEPHGEAHWVGEHTSRHRIAGTHRTCEEVQRGVGNRSPLGKLSTSRIIILALVATMISVGAAFGVQKVRMGLSGNIDFNRSGSVRVINSTIQAFTGQALEDTNVDQKALGGKSGPTTPPAIIFSNGEQAKGRENVHLYLDMGDKESRDLVLLNQSTLLSLVESGEVNLYVHPVPSGTAFSIYAAEALSEAAFLDPSDTWSAFLEILKTADVVLAKEPSANKMALMIAEAAKEGGVDGIDRESIQNGSFVSWLLSVAGDPRLVSGTKLPSLFVEDVSVQLPTLNLTNNRNFYNALEAGNE